MKFYVLAGTGFLIVKHWPKLSFVKDVYSIWKSCFTAHVSLSTCPGSDLCTVPTTPPEKTFTSDLNRLSRYVEGGWGAAQPSIN